MLKAKLLKFIFLIVVLAWAVFVELLATSTDFDAWVFYPLAVLLLLAFAIRSVPFHDAAQTATATPRWRTWAPRLSSP